MANEKMEGASAFARDLGYLDKFFANLTAHADTLAPASGARLKQLMAEEVERWQEIRRLIAGGAPSAAPVAPPAAPAPAVVAPAAAPAPSNPRPGLTVGSLIDRGPRA